MRFAAIIAASLMIHSTAFACSLDDRFRPTPGDATEVPANIAGVAVATAEDESPNLKFEVVEDATDEVVAWIQYGAELSFDEPLNPNSKYRILHLGSGRAINHQTTFETGDMTPFPTSGVLGSIQPGEPASPSRLPRCTVRSFV